MEPPSGLLRPIPMVPRAVGLAVAVLLAATTLAGCGQSPPGGPSGAATGDARGDAAVGSCAADSAQVKQAAAVPVDVDLDHDGSSDAVRVTGPDAQGCSNILFAEIAGKDVSWRLGDVTLDLRSATRVLVPHARGDLLAVRQTHPRGGYQVRLYGYDGQHLGEVTSNGNPVVPFVATDTRGGFVSTRCADDAIVVRRAVVDTSGGEPSWDIRETSYRLDGLRAIRIGDREVKHGVPDAQLDQAYPELIGRAMFKVGCGG